MSDRMGDLLDRAQAAREIAATVAIALMQSGGDPDRAIALLELVGPDHPPEASDQLDAATIGAQAIRDAQALRAVYEEGEGA